MCFRGYVYWYYHIAEAVEWTSNRANLLKHLLIQNAKGNNNNNNNNGGSKKEEDPLLNDYLLLLFFSKTSTDILLLKLAAVEASVGDLNMGGIDSSNYSIIGMDGKSIEESTIRIRQQAMRAI